MREEKKKKSEEHRILILGCGEAGKSTFIKQMQIIHSDGLGNESKRKEKMGTIIDNIMEAINTLIKEMSFVQENELHETVEYSDAVERLESISQTNFTPEDIRQRADDIKLLWDSSPIQKTYERRNEFQIVECARYFLSKVHEVLHPDYVPTEQDLLQMRMQTIGIVKYNFEMQANRKKYTLVMVSKHFRMIKKHIRVESSKFQIDVGGQRTERRKWIHFFDDVKVIMFLTAISEYDQVLAEDGHTNRLKESVNLFHTILNYQWFKNTSVVLFLNKKDLLEEKINSGRNPVQNYFPDCPQYDDESITKYEMAVEYFKHLFLEQNPNPEVRDIYPHVTCATDSKNIKVIDTAVQVVIMKYILGASVF